jgi:Ni,Fe-hydrogenase I cytochrome b subunit
MKLLLHPLPVRIFHWTMVACVMGLLLTGLFISSPPAWLRLPMGLLRELHGACAAVLIVNFAGHVYYYAYTGKYTEILLLPGDWAHVRSFLRYYLFITAHHPNYGRYNPGQKALFTAWALAVIAAAVTGAALLFPGGTTHLQRLLGGLSAIRGWHFLVAAFFAATIPFHLYLVFTEEPAKLQAIFTGYVQKEPGVSRPSRREN